MWIPEAGRLIEHATSTVSNLDYSYTVADLVNDHAGWCLDKIIHLIPPEIYNLILALAPPRLGSHNDRIAWKPSKDGCFSTGSAYESILELEGVPDNSLFKSIFRWSGSERIRVHLWKLAQGAIITNAWRQRRGLTGVSTCPMCGTEDEDLVHMTRDCRGATQVWNFLADNQLPHDFFTTDIHQWLASNLKENSSCRGIKWQVIFGVATSVIWQARNEKLCAGKIYLAVEVGIKAFHQALAMHQSIQDNSLSGSLSPRGIPNILLWSHPDVNFVKCNCDAAVGQFGELVAAGGVTRDH